MVDAFFCIFYFIFFGGAAEGVTGTPPVTVVM